MESVMPMRFGYLKPKPDTVSLFIVGDIMSHRAVSKSAEEHGYASFFKHISFGRKALYGLSGLFGS